MVPTAQVKEEEGEGDEHRVTKRQISVEKDVKIKFEDGDGSMDALYERSSGMPGGKAEVQTSGRGIKEEPVEPTQIKSEPQPDVKQEESKEVKHHTSLNHLLLGPSLTKSGQESVDQTKVAHIMYEASKVPIPIPSSVPSCAEQLQGLQIL